MLIRLLLSTTGSSKLRYIVETLMLSTTFLDLYLMRKMRIWRSFLMRRRLRMLFSVLIKIVLEVQMVLQVLSIRYAGIFLGMILSDW